MADTSPSGQKRCSTWQNRYLHILLSRFSDRLSVLFERFGPGEYLQNFRSDLGLPGAMVG